MSGWKRSWLEAILGIATFVLLVGCGASAKPAPSVVPSSSQGTVAASSALTPAPAPADLIAVMRLKSPGALTDVLGRWVNLPFDWRSKLREVAGEIDSVVSFDAPVEAAAVLDPRPSNKPNVLFAASLGLTSFDGAISFLRARGQSPERLPSGAYGVIVGEGTHCIVARALGVAPARFICGSKERALEVLAPYLAQGLPNEALSTNQLHLELRAEPFRRRYGKDVQMLKVGVPFVLRELSVDSPRLDAALSDAAYALADEVIALSDDLDSVALDGVVDSSSEAVDLSLSMKLRGQGSWIAQSVADSGHRAGPPPEMFWTLPADATLASYQVSSNPQRREKFAALTGELAEGVMEYAGISGRVRERAAAALKQIFLIEGPSVYASGPVAEPAAPAPSDSKARLAALKAGLGYYLSAMDHDNGKLEELIREAVAVYGDPAFAKTLKGKKVSVDTLPSIKSHRVAPTQGLPTGSTVYELTLPSKAVAKWFDVDVKEASPMTFYGVVVPAGERAWLGVSADEQLIYTKLRAALKPQDETTLMRREGIATLRSTDAVSAGFFTLRYLLDRKGSFKSDHRHAWSDLSTKLQHRGDVPIVYRATISNDGREVKWTASAPRAVFEDIASAVVLLSPGD